MVTGEGEVGRDAGAVDEELAIKNGTTVAAIASANSIANVDNISMGQVLTIPSAESWRFVALKPCLDSVLGGEPLEFIPNSVN